MRGRPGQGQLTRCKIEPATAKVGKPPNPPLHGDADHCPDQAVGTCRCSALRAGLSPATGPIEDCRWLQLCQEAPEGGSKRGGWYHHHSITGMQ